MSTNHDFESVMTGLIFIPVLVATILFLIVVILAMARNANPREVADAGFTMVPALNLTIWCRKRAASLPRGPAHDLVHELGWVILWGWVVLVLSLALIGVLGGGNAANYEAARDLALGLWATTAPFFIYSQKSGRNWLRRTGRTLTLWMFKCFGSIAGGLFFLYFDGRNGIVQGAIDVFSGHSISLLVWLSLGLVAWIASPDTEASLTAED